MSENAPEHCPYSGSNVRAYHMVHNIGPIFTEYIDTMVQNEREAYRHVRIQSDQLADYTLLNFATGLGYYFQSKEFTGDEDSILGLKPEVRDVRDRSFVFLNEPHEGYFVRYGVRDSLEFAAIFIAATATSLSDVLKQNDLDVEPEVLLHRTDFQELMNQFALADFAFYKQGIITWPNNTADSIAERLFLKSFEELVEIDESGSVEIKESVRLKLIERIRAKNQAKLRIDTTALGVPNQEFSTAGCPVAHMIAEGNAIAIFCNFLADQYIQFRSKAEKGILQNLARTAMAGNPVKAVVPSELTRPAPRRVN